MQRKSFCLSLLIFILSSFAFSQSEIEVCGEEYLIYVEIPDEDTIRLVSEPDLYPGGWDSLSSIHFGGKPCIPLLPKALLAEPKTGKYWAAFLTAFIEKRDTVAKEEISEIA